MTLDGSSYDAFTVLPPAGSNCLYRPGGVRGAYDHLGPPSRPIGSLTTGHRHPVAASDMKTCDAHHLRYIASQRHRHTSHRNMSSERHCCFKAHAVFAAPAHAPGCVLVHHEADAKALSELPSVRLHVGGDSSRVLGEPDDPSNASCFVPAQTGNGALCSS